MIDQALKSVLDSHLSIWFASNYPLLLLLFCLLDHIDTFFINSVIVVASFIASGYLLKMNQYECLCLNRMTELNAHGNLPQDQRREGREDLEEGRHRVRLW